MRQNSLQHVFLLTGFVLSIVAFVITPGIELAAMNFVTASSLFATWPTEKKR